VLTWPISGERFEAIAGRHAYSSSDTAARNSRNFVCALRAIASNFFTRMPRATFRCLDPHRKRSQKSGVTYDVKCQGFIFTRHIHIKGRTKGGRRRLT
jgi:hypothetical protein